MAACLVLTLVIGSGATRIRYDHNLLNLQPRHLESADIERQIFARLNDSVFFAVSICPTRQELRARKARFEQLYVVARTEEIASLLPDSPPEQVRRIEQISRQLATLQEKPRAMPIDVLRLKQEVARGQDGQVDLAHQNMACGHQEFHRAARLLRQGLSRFFIAINHSRFRDFGRN